MILFNVNVAALPEVAESFALPTCTGTALTVITAFPLSAVIISDGISFQPLFSGLSFLQDAENASTQTSAQSDIIFFIITLNS